MGIVKSAKVVNLINLYGLIAVVLLSSILQFVIDELPCPLCLLQRFGLLAVCYGFLLNLRYEIKPRHYALSLIAALYTGTVSFRQILLHIVPGTKVYGEPFLGLSLYTWAFIVSVLLIFWISVLLLFNRQFKSVDYSSKGLKIAAHIAFILVLLLVILNIVTTFFICGFGQCPENPIAYKYI